MGILILVLVVLAAGVLLGFLLGFSKSMRETAKQTPARSNRPFIGRLFFGAGCICLVVAIGATFYSWNFIRTAHRTTGTVIEMREQTDKETGSKNYAPTVVFKSLGGTEHQITTSFYSYPPLHLIGDTVPVLYHPDTPDSARVDGFWYHWGLTTIAGILGGLHMSAGLVVLRWPRIRGRLGRSPP
jgi:formate/nitrite transporter FocA (FNT family)